MQLELQKKELNLMRDIIGSAALHRVVERKLFLIKSIKIKQTAI